MSKTLPATDPKQCSKGDPGGREGRANSGTTNVMSNGIRWGWGEPGTNPAPRGTTFVLS